MRFLHSYATDFFILQEVPQRENLSYQAHSLSFAGDKSSILIQKYFITKIKKFEDFRSKDYATFLKLSYINREVKAQLINMINYYAYHNNKLIDNNKTLFENGIKNGDAVLFIRIDENYKADKKEEIEEGNSLIKESSELNVQALYQILIKNPYLVNAIDSKKETILSYSLKNGNIEISNLILTSPILDLDYQDKDGKVVVEPTYDFTTDMDKYGFGGIAQDGKWGIINAKGKIIKEPKFTLDTYYLPIFVGEYLLEVSDTYHCLELK